MGIYNKEEGGQTFRGALVYQSAVLSIPDNIVTTLLFNLENYDTDSIHSVSANTGRLTVPVGVKKVKLQFGIATGSVAANTLFQLWLRKNDSVIINGIRYNNMATPLAGQSIALVASSPILAVVGGDYFNATVYQNSGATLDTRTPFQIFSMEIVK